MSKSSNKARIEQLKAWLADRKIVAKKNKPRRESRSDYYKKKGFNGARN